MIKFVLLYFFGILWFLEYLATCLLAPLWFCASGIHVINHLRQPLTLDLSRGKKKTSRICRSDSTLMSPFFFFGFVDKEIANIPSMDLLLKYLFLVV